MRFLLFLQQNAAAEAPAERVRPFLLASWPILLPLLLGFAAIYFALPRVRRSSAVGGGALGAIALVVAGLLLLHAEAVWPETLLFYTFSGLAVLAGGMMLAQSNPVYAALSFALVVLSSCGLFLLQGAPFLMAATIIIYAGAIVVTFLFVIMLAQQTGYDSADLRSREPFLATLAGFVLMGATLLVLHRALTTPDLDRTIDRLHQVAAATTIEEADRALGQAPPLKGTDGRADLDVSDQAKKYFNPEDPLWQQATQLESNWSARELGPLKANAAAVAEALAQKRERRGTLARGDIPGKANSTPGTLPARNVHALGQTLFTDYLVPVELAGVLLLVATIGAIAIAGRHSEVLR